jgi:tetratricopeptide (TPR) repeat protein
VIVRLENAIKLAPDFYEAQYSLGLQYAAVGKYDDAERAFLRARDLNSNESEPLISLGMLYYRQGEMLVGIDRDSDAVAVFKKSVNSF